MMTMADLLIKLLRLYGVNTVFGIPGVHTLELYRSLENSEIRHITSRHEQGAGFMADGYARVTGKPGVCFVITGPGMTNIATAMGQAYGDSIPLLVISSTNVHGYQGLGEGHLHELHSQSALISGVSAFSQTVLDPVKLPGVLARAFSIFEGKRPRPVHIEIPIDAFKLNASVIKGVSPLAVCRPAPNPQAIKQAAHLLSNAKSPLVLLGGGAVDAADEVRKIIELLDAPTGLTINAKGLLPPDHPLLCGSYISCVPMQDYISKADVILAIGTEMGETDYDLINKTGLLINGKLIRVDIEADQITRNYQPDIAITSDASLALRALIDNLGSLERASSIDGSLRTLDIRLKCEASTAVWIEAHKPWFDVIDQVYEDPIIVGDSTQPIYSANQFYNANSPRSYFNSATGYGTLGYALPASIGAKLAEPQRNVICFIGDGGILFTIGELASAIEAKVGIIILLWNNKGYQTIKEYMLEFQVPPIGCIEFTPDFQTIASGFGCKTAHVNSPEALRSELKKLNKLKKPALIEIT